MKNILSLLTAVTQTDSYKMSQWLQYPSDTTHISSYIEARGGEPTSVFFGLQAFIQEYLTTPITESDVNIAERLIKAHGEPFNRAGWMIIVNEYNGMLPVEIQAVPEGTVMATGNVQVQVVNTDPRLFWLTSYIETALLRAVWYPSTVATISRKMKKVLAKALHETSDIPVKDQLPFKLHDFGARGASSTETAVLGGMSHLVNFSGTDTFEGILGAMTYYDSEVCGFSIPASEHSTITSWGSENEVEAYKNMIEQFAGEGNIFACVSDSYDIYHAAGVLWPSLKQQLVDLGGTLVVRPDSGDPLTVPVEIVKLLMSSFGYSVNSKGYKVLPSCVRVIQGDGIDSTSLPKIVEAMIREGLSLDNLAFGMGGGLLQKVDRDTLKYAMKASARRDAEGVWHDVYKDPVTDSNKQSKRGRLGLVVKNNVITTVREQEAGKDNLLTTVYRNGAVLTRDSFEKVRSRAELKESEYV